VTPLRVAHVHGGRQMCGVSNRILTAMRFIDRSAVESQLLLLRGGAVADKARAYNLPFHVCGPRFPGDLGAVFRMAEWLKRSAIDVLHTHTINSNFYGRLAARLVPRVTLVSTVHTFVEQAMRDTYPNHLVRAVVARQNALTGRWVKLFIATCRELEVELRASVHPSAGIRLIYNGLDLAEYPSPDSSERARARATFGIPEGIPCIGAVGRLVGIKQIPLLLEAVATLQGQVGEFRLLVAGDGPERHALERLAADIGLGRKVVFAGWIDRVREAYCAMDIYAMPSASETLSYSTMEAMAMGVVPVAFSSGGLPDLVTPETGILVDPGNRAAFADALGQLIADCTLRKSMGAAGRARIESHFEARRMAVELTAAYRSATNHTKSCVGD